MQSTSSSLKLLSDATINFSLINGNNSYILIPNVPTATRLSPNISIITPGLMTSLNFLVTPIQPKSAEIPLSFFNFPKCNLEHPRSLLRNLQCFLTACYNAAWLPWHAIHALQGPAPTCLSRKHSSAEGFGVLNPGPSFRCQLYHLSSPITVTNKTAVSIKWNALPIRAQHRSGT